jgi:hypothetical protein
MDPPVVQEWGPRLWRVLHSLAECTGKRNYKGYHDNEQRCWINIMNSLLKGLPCAVCKKHFREYYASGKFGDIFLKKGDERREELRKWLWTFHNHVRIEKEQPIDIEFEKLSELYTPYTRDQFNNDIAVIREHIRRGMFLRMLVRDDLVRVVRALDELWCILHT